MVKVALSLLALVASSVALPAFESQQLTFNDAARTVKHAVDVVPDLAKDAFGRVRKAHKWAVEGLVRQFDEVTAEGITCESLRNLGRRSGAERGRR